MIAVASVSYTYDRGSPDKYRKINCSFRRGEVFDREEALHRLVDMQFTRNNLELQRITSRQRSPLLAVWPPAGQD